MPEDLQKHVSSLEEELQQLHRCEAHLAIRLRPVAGGHRHVVHQCSICGLQRGQALSKARAAQALGGADPEPFDDALQERYRAKRHRIFQDYTAASRELLVQTDPDRLRVIEEHIQERELQAQKNEAATARAQALIDQAIEAILPVPWMYRWTPLAARLVRHHASVFRNPQAKPVHQFSSEPELREWLDGLIAEDFEVFPEVWGRHLTEDVSVKIDYVLRPREHLVRAGFKPGPLGLEVKHLPIEHGFSSKASRFIWQAVSYTDCEFSLAGQAVRLPRVLLFSNVSFEDECALLSGVDVHPLTNDKAKWTALLELANHANVGNLEIYGTREQATGWHITFAGGTYFRRRSDQYSLSNANLFEKIRIGNF